jgi:hypothetical protein
MDYYQFQKSIQESAVDKVALNYMFFVYFGRISHQCSVLTVQPSATDSIQV